MLMLATLIVLSNMHGAAWWSHPDQDAWAGLSNGLRCSWKRDTPSQAATLPHRAKAP